jgi:hypothetical protein
MSVQECPSNDEIGVSAAQLMQWGDDIEVAVREFIKSEFMFAQIITFCLLCIGDSFVVIHCESIVRKEKTRRWEPQCLQPPASFV